MIQHKQFTNLLSKYQMKAEEFKKKWTAGGEEISAVDLISLSDLSLKEETISFLNTSGLPRQASPFLTFVKNTDGQNSSIRKIPEVYKGLGKEFEKFIIIGSDGYGNPVVINAQENDQIEVLDHEESFSSRYMNKSIEELGGFLLGYREFVETIINENGEDAYLDANFTDKQFNQVRELMLSLDAEALKNENFWSLELNTLLANREN